MGKSFPHPLGVFCTHLEPPICRIIEKSSFLGYRLILQILPYIILYEFLELFEFSEIRSFASPPHVPLLCQRILYEIAIRSNYSTGCRNRSSSMHTFSEDFISVLANKYVFEFKVVSLLSGSSQGCGFR